MAIVKAEDYEALAVIVRAGCISRSEGDLDQRSLERLEAAGLIRRHIQARKTRFQTKVAKANQWVPTGDGVLLSGTLGSDQ